MLGPDDPDGDASVLESSGRLYRFFGRCIVGRKKLNRDLMDEDVLRLDTENGEHQVADVDCRL